jgi:hypothetical protein
VRNNSGTSSRGTKKPSLRESHGGPSSLPTAQWLCVSASATISCATEPDCVRRKARRPLTAFNASSRKVQLRGLADKPISPRALSSSRTISSNELVDVISCRKPRSSRSGTQSIRYASYRRGRSRGESKYSTPACRSTVTTQSHRRCRHASISLQSGDTSVINTGQSLSPAPMRLATPRSRAECALTRRSEKARATGCFSPSGVGGMEDSQRGTGAASKRRSGVKARPWTSSAPLGTRAIGTHSTRVVKMSKAKARCAEVLGVSLSRRAQARRGRLTPPGRVTLSSSQRSSSGTTPAPLRRRCAVAARNLPTMLLRPWAG